MKKNVPNINYIFLQSAQNVETFNVGTEKKIAQFIPTTYIKYLTHCANRRHLIDFVEMRRRKNVFLLRKRIPVSVKKRLTG